MIDKKKLLSDIEKEMEYARSLNVPQMVAGMSQIKKVVQSQPEASNWIPTSERLPQLPDGKSFMPLNATILAPSGLRNTVQMTWELKRGKPTWCYLGEISDWNVIAWQPLPEPWKGRQE